MIAFLSFPPARRTRNPDDDERRPAGRTFRDEVLTPTGQDLATRTGDFFASVFAPDEKPPPDPGYQTPAPPAPSPGPGPLAIGLGGAALVGLTLLVLRAR